MYILQQGDPRPLRGDQIHSEQVEVIPHLADAAIVVQADINAFLVMLRDDLDHVVKIRSVNTMIDSITGMGAITGVTVIHYLLVGSIDPPYIP